MNHTRQTAGNFMALTAALLLPSARLAAAEAKAPAALRLSLPLNYQVSQRVTRTQGRITVAGALPNGSEEPRTLEARLVGTGAMADWRTLVTVQANATEIHAEMSAPAGGWYRLEVRVQGEGPLGVVGVVGHAGVGEVFVIAGQSNSANHGDERQQTRTGLVATFHADKWQLANDPQPGASGSGGSFTPAFGDAIAERSKVPVGLIAVGLGATSVREWLPRGARFPNPPTLTGQVRDLASGEWESKGILFESLVARTKALGPRGFRAVLWHQGESDANQKDTSRTLPGTLYRQYLEKLIRDSRRELSWEVPWFVAKAPTRSDRMSAPRFRTRTNSLSTATSASRPCSFMMTTWCRASTP